MPAPSLPDTESLTDSAYELISSADDESQDGRGTESLAESLADSLDMYPRPDDVRSLSGHARARAYETESASDDEGGDEPQHPDDSGGADSIRYAEEVLGHPSTQSLPSPSSSHDADALGDAAAAAAAAAASPSCELSSSAWLPM